MNYLNQSFEDKLLEIKNLPDPEMLNRLAREGKIDYFHRKLPLIIFTKLKDNNPFIINSLIENDNLFEKITLNESNHSKRLVNDMEITDENKKINKTNKNNKEESIFIKTNHPEKFSSNFNKNNINNNIHYKMTQNKLSIGHNIKQISIKNTIIDGILLENNKIQCAVSGCKKIFKNKYKLNDHLVTHSNDKSFICDIDDCKKEFKRKQTLNRHIRSYHLKTNRYKCEKCHVCFAHPNCN